jgi:hypothetical protein
VISDIEAAYIAGLLDGEGTICFSHHLARPKLNREFWQPKVTIANTNRAVIEWLAAKMGGSIAQHHQKAHWRRCYVWNAKDIRGILRTVQPFLRIKARQAEIVLAFLDTRHFGKRASHQLVLQRRIWQGEVAFLNKRGRAA